LCRDSILAAPLVIEIARTLDLASQRGEGGIQEQLGVFFKAPMTIDGNETEHDFGKQEARLRTWLTSERKVSVPTR
jgi:myo-inositol-1-phosphate synthase